MCLDRITRKLKKYQEGTGYKIFVKSQGECLTGQFLMDISRPIGKWIKEKDYRNYRDFKSVGISDFYNNDNISYQFGWHIYSTRKAATFNLNVHSIMSEVVRKVKYRKAHTIGVQHGRKVIVAKEIFIIDRGISQK